MLLSKIVFIILKIKSSKKLKYVAIVIKNQKKNQKKKRINELHLID